MGAMLNKVQRGRRARNKRSGFSDINVTPLVDVMLVLLIVFMVAAPMLTVGVPVDLPKTNAAQLNDQAEPIVVSVDANGKSYLQETELNGEELIGRLMAITGSNPEARIFVRGDQKLAYGRIMEVMGDIAAAGFHKVSLIAEMPMGPSKPKLKIPTQPQSPVSPAKIIDKPQPALHPKAPVAAGKLPATPASSSKAMPHRQQPSAQPARPAASQPQGSPVKSQMAPMNGVVPGKKGQ